MLKRLASHLPLTLQQELKRLHFRRLIRRGVFTTAEAHDTEFPRLAEWVRAGDWVLDVGANVGNYTARMSELVGPTGRVVSFEPVPETFELLVSNVAQLRHRNVTLLNLAASDAIGARSMSIPVLANGLENRYMAQITDTPGDLNILSVPIDSLQLPQPIRLVKVDVEGHELPALKGMADLLRRDCPRLIVEGRDPEVAALLTGLGYSCEEQPASPNRVFAAGADR